MVAIILKNNSAEAINLLRKIVELPEFQEFVREHFPNQYFYLDNQLFTNEPLVTETRYKKVREGVKELDKLRSLENVPLMKCP
jgi:hypothetical protein